MAAHIGQPTHSRRFIKIYLGTWGLLAVGSLAYLAVLAFPPHVGTPQPEAYVAPPESNPAPPAEPTKVAEVSASPSEVHKELPPQQGEGGARVPIEKVVKTQVTAQDDRGSGADSPLPAQKSAENKAPEEASTKIAQPVAATETATDPGKAQAEVPPPPFVPIETGSITPGGNMDAPEAAPKDAPKAPNDTAKDTPKEAPAKEAAKEEIVFGEPIVTRGGQPEFAVHLASGASLKALRQSWGQLRQRHAAALDGLQPRVVAPRGEGGSYRLIAGPVPTKAAAEHICTELHAGPKACFPTPYAGAPL
jgi:hypothetical protein